MPAAARVSDLAKADSDAHGCPACPHPPLGPAIIGSNDVMINSLPALRQNDTGVHAVCCGPNMWTAQMGSSTVNINSKQAMRSGDMTTHCGGVGSIQSPCSTNVNIGG
jgi:uncharacterized Zn-binding protein involved in type VI secretion